MREIFIQIKKLKGIIRAVVMVNDERMLIAIEEHDDSISGGNPLGTLFFDLPRNLLFPNRTYKIPFPTIDLKEFPQAIRQFDGFKELPIDCPVIIIEKDEIDYYHRNWEGFYKVIFKNGLTMHMRNHPKRVGAVLKKWGYKEGK